MKNLLLNLVLIVGITMTWSACQPEGSTKKPTKQNQTSAPTSKPAKAKVNYPKFDETSAYNHIQKQVDFGPRVPGTPEHKMCADWLEEQMKMTADEVIVQEAKLTVYNGKQVPMYNIISSYNPSSKNRILLSAHWDTRPFADQDDDKSRENEPIEGANDGASGVGVLMAVGEALKANPLKNIGVDIIFWDVEDYGKGEAETYCLGSQHWSNNKHKPSYKAMYGILLDMVGAKNAVFNQEGYSLHYAPHVVKKVWEAAHKSGFSGFFPFVKVDPITDDHKFLNEMGRIPTIDIIQYDRKSFPNSNGFFPHWHTHEDNMSKIDKRTLNAVGQTLLTVLYDEDAQ